jgi:hypothetical protein
MSLSGLAGFLSRSRLLRGNSLFPLAKQQSLLLSAFPFDMEFCHPKERKNEWLTLVKSGAFKFLELPESGR